VCSDTDEDLAHKFLDSFTTEVAKLGLEQKGVRSLCRTILVSCNERKGLADKFVSAIRNSRTVKPFNV